MNHAQPTRGSLKPVEERVREEYIADDIAARANPRPDEDNPVTVLDPEYAITLLQKGPKGAAQELLEQEFREDHPYEPV